MPSSVITKRYYPKLSEVVTVDDLPEYLDFAENGLNDLLGRIHYRNMQFSKSYRGDAAFYSLDIVAGNIGYEAKIKIFHGDLDVNDGFKVKSKKSTFFPDSWDKQKVQQELAFAYANKIYKHQSTYTGTMTDGVEVAFFIENGSIKTAFTFIPKALLP